MWKRPLDVVNEELAAEVGELRGLGCDILRFAVPDETSAGLLGELAGRVAMPLVADIHFDYRIALRCLDFPIAKIRINPGNIGAEWKVREVVAKAKDRGVPIRIGVNGGSLPAKLRGEADRARAMLKAAEEEIEILESLDFRQVIVSMKSSDIESTVEANFLFAERFSYPLHLGVTEAGPLIPGIVKSTLAFARLLERGIGSTVRVSLSDSPASEVIAGKEILASLGLRSKGVNIVSCPRCGRSTFDVHAFLRKAEGWLHSLNRDITVAVMGCAVNGPGEASHADVGITGSGNAVIIFRGGKVVRRVSEDEAFDAFREEVEKA